MPNCRYLISVLAAALFLAGCTTPLQTPFTNVGVQKERILLWHTWSPQQTIALEAMLAAYEQFNPAVEVISIAIPEAQLATTSGQPQSVRVRAGPALGRCCHSLFALARRVDP